MVPFRKTSWLEFKKINPFTTKTDSAERSSMQQSDRPISDLYLLVSIWWWVDVDMCGIHGMLIYCILVVKKHKKRI